jgi:hypothetical protein
LFEDGLALVEGDLVARFVDELHLLVSQEFEEVQFEAATGTMRIFGEFSHVLMQLFVAR